MADLIKCNRDTANVTAISRAQEGDCDAFVELYKRYRSYVLAIISDSIRDPHSQNDVVQATFEKAWTKLPSLRRPDAFKPWLAQITRRLVIDHHRSASRSVTTDFSCHNAVDVESADWSAIEWASRRELADSLAAAIHGLSARDAAVIEMSAISGWSPTEIAAALDVDASHARVLIHRARRRLRQAVFVAA